MQQQEQSYSSGYGPGGVRKGIGKRGQVMEPIKLGVEKMIVIYPSQGVAYQTK